MAHLPPVDVLSALSEVPDPRVLRTRRHKLLDILFIALCASLCGADSFRAFAEFGQSKEVWLRTFLELPGGIPSHQTFARIFGKLNSPAFSHCFLGWVEGLRQGLAQRQALKSTPQSPTGLSVCSDAKSAAFDLDLIPGASSMIASEQQAEEILQRGVSIDGKTLRRSFDKGSDTPAIHMVSAWSWYERLVLGQVKTDDRSNEITAIPELIGLLDLKGCLVTIDAAGTQKAIARAIKEKGADYVLALKKNQPELYKDVTAYLDQWIERGFRDENDQIVEHTTQQTFDADHGRIETRRCWAMLAPAWLHKKEQWTGLTTVAVVEAERIVGEKKTVSRRYYISSTPPSAQKIARAVRNHWGIENQLHWVLDMSFREDESRVRANNAPQNLATLRHFALNLIRNEKREKRSIKRKRLLAGWRNDYLQQIITGQHTYSQKLG